MSNEFDREWEAQSKSLCRCHSHTHNERATRHTPSGDRHMRVDRCLYLPPPSSLLRRSPVASLSSPTHGLSIQAISDRVVWCGAISQQKKRKYIYKQSEWEKHARQKKKPWEPIARKSIVRTQQQWWQQQQQQQKRTETMMSTTTGRMDG